jgi:hypothetical protein
VVCDPFGGGGGGTNGLKASLFYFNDSEVADKSNLPYRSVGDFFTKGHPANVDVYLSYVYVPTRAFSLGFQTTDGAILTRPDGTKLYEYFALKMTGGIQLRTGSPKKQYQFALLTDDGARLYITTKSATGSPNRILVVDNDGDHSSQFVNASQPIELSATDRLPIEIQYYQGPRQHIAAILLWREWPGTSYNDPQNRKYGNDYFFDSTFTPSKPLAPWTDIMTRWSVVPSEVLYTDLGDGTNPCDEATATKQ